MENQSFSNRIQRMNHIKEKIISIYFNQNSVVAAKEQQLNYKV